MAQPFQAILTVVSKFREVSIADLKGPRRDQSIIIPRFEAIYLAHVLTGYSNGVIGKHLGNRDNSTVRQALIRIEERISNYPQLCREIEEMRVLAKRMIEQGPSIQLTNPAEIDPIEVAMRVHDACQPCLIVTADEVRALAAFVVGHAPPPNLSIQGVTT